MTLTLAQSPGCRRNAVRRLGIGVLVLGCAGSLWASHAAFGQSGSAPTIQAIPNETFTDNDILAQQGQSALAAQSSISLQQTPTLPSHNAPFSGQNLYPQQLGNESLLGHPSPPIFDLNPPLGPT
jgi:hypothetical protein